MLRASLERQKKTKNQKSSCLSYSEGLVLVSLFSKLTTLSNSSEVLVVVDEGGTFKPVSGSTGRFHAIGHSRRAAGEDSDLRQHDVLLLKVVEEAVEVWTPEVSYCLETSEQTASRELLEVPLTNVLKKRSKTEVNTLKNTFNSMVHTNMVVRRSNLSKNWVTKMWFSTSPLVSASSTSRMMSVNHSHCFWLRVTQMKNT